MLICGYVWGSDQETKHIKQTLIRYVLCMQCLTFRSISTAVRKRFPSEENLLELKLMTQEELKEFKEIDEFYGKWWVPCPWFTALAVEAYKKGLIANQIFLSQILEELHNFRSGCARLFAFDWISIPLVYTQTVTIACYTYFGAKVVGRQFIDPSILNAISKGTSEHKVYIPIFTILEFFFFIGWLKVAEQLINPFGEDDDDFDCNWIIDRNKMVSNIILNQIGQKHPHISKKVQTPEEALLNRDLRRRNSINPHSGSTINLDLNKRSSFKLAQHLFKSFKDRSTDMQESSTGGQVRPGKSSHNVYVKYCFIFFINHLSWLRL